MMRVPQLGRHRSALATVGAVVAVGCSGAAGECHRDGHDADQAPHRPVSVKNTGAVGVSSVLAIRALSA